MLQNIWAQATGLKGAVLPVSRKESIEVAKIRRTLGAKGEQISTPRDLYFTGIQLTIARFDERRRA
jgi:hypothetical protein